MDSCLLRQREQKDANKTLAQCLASEAEELALQVAGTAKGIVEKCRRQLQNVGFDALPDWLKKNEYLKQGYRPPTKSFRDCFKRVLRWHTETGNIWTHLIGFALLVALSFFSFTQSSFGSGYLWDADSIIVRQLSTGEQVTFGIFYGGGLLCLLASSVFHIVCSHSECVSKAFNQLDYVGIVFLISGSHIAAIYYSFYCRPYLHLIYTTSVIVLGSGCAAVMLIRSLALRYRTLRAGLFLAFGLCGAFPVIHILIVDGIQSAMEQCAIVWIVLMALSYISGVAIYVTKVPECWFPGKCDLLIHSHQIFHVLVLAGIWLFYNGLLSMAEYRRTVGTSCVDSVE